MKNKHSDSSLPLHTALIPLFVLIVLLAMNVWVYGDNALSGSNQFILLVGGAVAALVGFVYNFHLLVYF